MNGLLTRLKQINNKASNIGWGSNDISELFPDADKASVLVVGHNVYRKIITLVIKKHNNCFTVDKMDTGMTFEKNLITDCNENEVVLNIIANLKEWFPERTTN